MKETNFCKKCGARVVLCGVGGLYKECVNCFERYYDNPKVGVSGIYIKGKKILLGKRKNSYEDKWCIPCGYLEREEVEKGMKREYKEETNLDVVKTELYDVTTNIYMKNQVENIFYLIKEVEGNLEAKDDLKKVGFFGKNDINNLAFSTDVVIINKLVKEKYL